MVVASLGVSGCSFKKSVGLIMSVICVNATTPELFVMRPLESGWVLTDDNKLDLLWFEEEQCSSLVDITDTVEENVTDDEILHYSSSEDEIDDEDDDIIDDYLISIY